MTEEMSESNHLQLFNQKPIEIALIRERAKLEKERLESEYRLDKGWKEELGIRTIKAALVKEGFNENSISDDFEEEKRLILESYTDEQLMKPIVGPFKRKLIKIKILKFLSFDMGFLRFLVGFIAAVSGILSVVPNPDARVVFFSSLLIWVINGFFRFLREVYGGDCEKIPIERVEIRLKEYLTEERAKLKLLLPPPENL